MAVRPSNTNGSWHPLRRVWDQIGPTVMRGTKLAQSWGIPVNPLVQKVAEAVLKKEWLTLGFIGLIARGKYDTVGLFALGMFAWEGFARKCFDGKIWKVPVSLGPEDPNALTYFEKLMNHFDVSKEVLDLRISLLEAEIAQIKERLDGNSEAKITGLRQLELYAQGMGNGQVSGATEVDLVRKAAQIQADAEDGDLTQQGLAAKNTIQQRIKTLEDEIQGLEREIGQFEQKKRAFSQMISINTVAIITVVLLVLQKIPIIGGMSSTIITIALGIILGNQAYCWATSKDKVITCKVCHQDPTDTTAKITCAAGHALGGDLNAIMCTGNPDCLAKLPNGLTRPK